MQKEHKTYFDSPEEIRQQCKKLFSRPFRYIVRSDEIELVDQRKDSVFYYQTDIVVLFKPDIINKESLFNIFKRAVEATIIQLELCNTALNVPLFIYHSYYIFTKNEERDSYSHFRNHGNEFDAFVTDTVQFVVGIDQIQESYIENYILQLNHLECARRFFRDQFEHSNVIVHEISHIVFYIQPFDTSTAIKRKLFWQNECIDRYED